MSRDSVGVEIATVTFDSSNRALFQQILAELDEQVLDPYTRRHMARNGLVGGSLGTHLPRAIQVLLMESADRREYPTAENQAEPADQQRFVQCPPNKPKGIGGLWSPLERLKLRHHDGDLIIPVEYDHASMMFEMQCEQTGYSSATVALTPEVQHGQLRQKYVVNGGSFHMAAQQEKDSYDDLKVEFELSSGETLMLSCNEQPETLGQRIFQNETGARQKILLIRLAQTQVDLSFEEAE